MIFLGKIQLVPEHKYKLTLEFLTSQSQQKEEAKIPNC